MYREQLFDRLARDRALRMMLRITERVEHHDAVRHGWKNRAQPMLAIETLGDPGHRALHRALAQRPRKPRRAQTQYPADPAEEPKPSRLLLPPPRRPSHRLPHLLQPPHP